MTAGTEWQNYAALTAPSASDDLLIRDTAATPPAAGTVKRITAPDLVAGALTARGAVQYSTAYSPGDVVLYYGEYILITAAVTTGAGTNGLGQAFISAADYIKLTSQGCFWASDYGVTANGTTDDWTALQSLLVLVRSLASSSFKGYAVILPAGKVLVSKRVILPTQTRLSGQGLYSTTIAAANGANCNVVEPEEYGNAAQLADLQSLQPSIASTVNAFRWRIDNLTLHGNSSGQAAGSYYHCLHVETSPLTSTASGDPDFDPAGIVENVQFRSASGDGFYHAGRSALRMVSCIAWFCQGNGFTPSFDTQFSACQAGFNGAAGWYVNHGAIQGAANKSYNNGTIAAWASGSSYSAGTRVLYNGAFYDAISALTNDTVAPSSDTANWAAVTGATAPAAWGAGVYFDSNAGEVTFQCDCQENSAHNWWFHGCAHSGIQVSGASVNPNWDQATSAPAASNPSYYADACADGASGIVADIACGQVSSASAYSYRLRLVNAPARLDLRLAGDANAAALLTPDSTVTLPAAGIAVNYNGVIESPSTGGGASGLTKQGATAAAGYALANSTGTILSWTAPNDGALHVARVVATIDVTAAETGGYVQIDFTYPSGTTANVTVFAGSLTVQQKYGQLDLLVEAGTTVSLVQSSALTAGAATVWAQLWGA